MLKTAVLHKIDLHTHSIASPDGGLRALDYRRMLDSGGLDAVAVTDHDSILFAHDLHKKLGDRIIVGEEITTTDGEIIGLFLNHRVSPGLSPEETVQNIHLQGGLVYIPHPFENVRKGVSHGVLERIAADVDIIEVYNGRAYFQDKSSDARHWAKSCQLVGAASSDAHGRIGWGRTYSLTSGQPTKENLVSLLRAASLCSQKVGIRGIFYPKLNRIRKRYAHGV